MAFNIGAVTATLSTRLNQFEKGMKKAETTLKQFQKSTKKIKSVSSKALKSAEDSFRTFGNSVKRIFEITIGNTIANTISALSRKISQLVQDGFGLTADLETAESAFKNIFSGQEEAFRTIQRIKKEAKKTPFELGGLIEGVKQIGVVTKDGDKSIDLMLAFGKAVTASGGGADELNRALFNLKQVGGLNELSAIDLKEFRRAIPLFDDIIKASGTTIEQVRNSDDVFQSLVSSFETGSKKIQSVDRAFIDQAGNMNQLWSNFKDVIGIATSEILEKTGIFDKVKEKLQAITKAIVDNQDTITGFIDGAWKNLITVYKTGKETIKKTNDEIEKISTWYNDNKWWIDNLAVVLAGIATGFALVYGAIFILNTTIGIASGLMIIFGATMVTITSPIFLVALAIGALIAIGFLLWKNWDFLKGKASDIFEAIKIIIKSKLDQAKKAFETFKEVVNKKIQDFIDKVLSIKDILGKIDLYDLGKQTIESFLKGIEDTADKVIKKAKDMANSVKDSIANALQIKSPSRVTMKLGEFTTEGFVKGMENKESLLNKSSMVMADIPKRVFENNNTETERIIERNSGSQVTINQYGSNLDTGFLPKQFIFN